MTSGESVSFTPSGFIATVNQTLEYAYSSVVIIGEVASFSINKGKWIFFDLKDDESSVSCFMAVWNLRIPLEDGMKVAVRGTPKLMKQGKCSITVNAIKPVGEGSLKKAYELLKKKLSSEGLFDPAKKRPLPEDLTRLGIISSTGAAGYGDFIKIINNRWGGIKVQVANTQVQGIDAPDQIIRALKYFNERGDVQVIAILRGGGSADDLSCFNDEALVREIAGSRIPVITGIGHDRDESLADLAADVRALTPTNAGEILTRDKMEEKSKLSKTMEQLKRGLLQNIEKARMDNRGKVGSISRGLLTKYIEPMSQANREKVENIAKVIRNEFEKVTTTLEHKKKLLEALNPEKVLKQGYAILSGKISPGSVVKITTIKQEISAEVKEIHERR